MPAADGHIRIIVGAGLDRSVEGTFGQIPKIAERTAKQVAKALNGATAGGGGGGNAMAKSMRGAATEADKASRDIAKSWDRQLAAANRVAAAQDRIFMKAARDRVREEEKAARDIERIQKRETREKEREAARQTRDAAREIERQMAQQDRARDRFATRTSHRAVRFLFPNPIGAFGMARRIGGDILRGAGVDASVAGSVSRAVGLQALATQLSSQGFMPQEKGANSMRVASSTLEAEARKTARDQAMDPEAMLRAQTKFVDITGNLSDARAAMPKIAALAGATGTDTEKMAEAWANVSRHIGDVPNKAEKVYGLMKLISGQGRVGSIEIKDEAKDLGKIAAMADKFGGDRAETIGKLTTLAQLGKAEGGSASSAQAATSIVSFVNTLQTPARVKTMMAAGMKEEDLFNMTGEGKNRVRTSLKDPFAILKKGLEVTGGDLIKFGNMFKSVMAQRATNALVAAYNSGGGRNMGAVDEKLAAFGKEATLTDKQVDDNNAERLKTDAAKAQDFQNALDEVIATTKNELTPALVELKEPALQAAHYLSEMVGFAAQHPLEAVEIAIVAAIARAGIESAFRGAIERAITGGSINVSGVTTIGTAALMIGALTLAWEQLDSLQKENGGWEGVKAFVGAGDNPYDFGFSAVDAEMDKQARERVGQKPDGKGEGQPKPPSNDGLPASWALPKPSGFGFGMPGEKGPNAPHNEQLSKVHSAIEHMHSSLKGNINVTVTNMPPGGPGGGPRVSPAGRGPSPNLPRSWD